METPDLVISGMEYHPSVIHADIAELTLVPGMDFASYAGHILDIQGRLSLRPSHVGSISPHSPLRKPKNFVDAVSQGTEVLVEEAQPEELEAAKKLLVDYSRKVQETATLPNYYKDYSYLSWVFKLRSLGGLTRSTEALGRSNEAESQYSSEQFWRDVYVSTIRQENSKQAYENYLLGPHIEDKDPSFISSVIDRIHVEGLSDVFSTEYSHDPEKLVRIGFDNFKLVLDEAAAVGWKNAAGVRALLDQIPAKDQPHYALLNKLGNQVTALINRDAILPGETELRPLQVYNIADAAEAINRCSDLVFVYGKAPEGHDPINFEFTTQLDAILLMEAATRMQASREA